MILFLLCSFGSLLSLNLKAFCGYSLDQKRRREALCECQCLHMHHVIYGHIISKNKLLIFKKKSKLLVHLFLKPWKAGLSFFSFFFFLKGLQQAETMETCIIKIDNHNNALKSTGRSSDDWKAKEIISSQGQIGFLKGFQLVEKK